MYPSFICTQRKWSHQLFTFERPLKSTFWSILDNIHKRKPDFLKNILKIEIIIIKKLHPKMIGSTSIIYPIFKILVYFSLLYLTSLHYPLMLTYLLFLLSFTYLHNLSIAIFWYLNFIHPLYTIHHWHDLHLSIFYILSTTLYSISIFHLSFLHQTSLTWILSYLTAQFFLLFLHFTYLNLFAGFFST